MKYTLIANSGLQFKTTQMCINPGEPLYLPGGQILGYTFKEKLDLLHGGIISFDLCSYKHYDQTNTDCYLPCKNLREQNQFAKMPGGSPELDEFGVLKLASGVDLKNVTSIKQGDSALTTVNTFQGLYLTKQNSDGTVESKTPFDILLGKWLPMPMYEVGVTKQSNNRPNGWCRVRIDTVSEPDRRTGKQEFRLTWAFDTGLATGEQNVKYRPFFESRDGESKEYSLCNRADILLGDFLTIPGMGESPVSRYLETLLQIQSSTTSDNKKYTFIGYYVYLINYLRLVHDASPEITLYNRKTGQIPVDMSIDIGNSRTCTVLFDNGKFSDSCMLRLTDMSEPWRTYQKAFDMRIAFRQAVFGDSGLNSGDDSLFQYKSLVRVGEEAKRLVHRSWDDSQIQDVANRERHYTDYSSPKRYLWDDKEFEPDRFGWEFLVVSDDPDTIKNERHHPAYITNLSDYFDEKGHFLGHSTIRVPQHGVHYSRSSLMVFIMIELLQQAMSYINTDIYRTQWGNIDCRRYLRNIVVTCPTAMPLKEQLVLRQAALDAAKYLRCIIPDLPDIIVTPDPAKIMPSNNPVQLAARGWLYDEALANQLVYIYAELNEKYSGNADDFLNLKGHFRQELNFQGNSLTIGSIDIGAGTTDVMITAYGKNGGSITPLPLYYDSFYTAGDDILRKIISNVILEGSNDSNDINQGSIANALKLRIKDMQPDDILKIKRVSRSFSGDVADIRQAQSEAAKEKKKGELANKLMRLFFGDNQPEMWDYDRRCRLDFNTQISVPMAQFFLEQLKEDRQRRKYSFEEIFEDSKPAEYLLNHFEYNFGFRFEELQWDFTPDAIGRIVSGTMERLIKVLSSVFNAYHCDVLVFSGRPTGLKPMTELLYKYIPVEPHKLILLNEYRVGTWYPFNDGRGFYDENQKGVVAVGAEVGYLASTVGFGGLRLDFSQLGQKMFPVAKIMGEFGDNPPAIRQVLFTPAIPNANLQGVATFPYYIGCKQFDSLHYPARPLYALDIEKSSGIQSANLVLLRRDSRYNNEEIEILSARDSRGQNIPLSKIELRLQTLTDNGNFWMDNGVFGLTI